MFVPLPLLPMVTQSATVLSMRLGAAALMAIGLFACGVSLTDATTGEMTVNSCSQSSECGGGICRDSLCQTDQTDIPALLLNVTPPTGVPTIAGIGFNTVVSGFESGPYGYEVTLGSLSYIEGIASGFELSDEKCLIDVDSPTAPPSPDDSIPVRLTLTPRERLIGLPSAAHTTEVDALQGGAYKFNMVVPAGRYDIYFEPLGTADGCVRPPYLAVDEEFAPGGVTLTMDLPTPEPLLVKIRYPQITDDLSGFLVDIVERDSGRLLSNRVRLTEPSETEEGLEYSAALAFSQVDGDQAAPATELIRLSPPEGVVAPTLLVERSVVDLFQDGEGLIDQLTDLPDPVSFSARIAVAGSPTPAPATVLLVATELKSTGPGTVAAFSRVVETDDQGFFEVQLLPGNYHMSAEPLDRNLARAEVELTVSDGAAIQVGKTVEVKERHRLEGRVVTFNGERVAGAPIWAGPVPAAGRSSLLKDAQGLLRPLPTAVGTTSESDGKFSMLADAGLFNVAARPEPGSGFAWRIRLGVDTTAGDVSVGRVELSLPLVVEGVLASPDLSLERADDDLESDDPRLVPDALIRAYAFLKDGKLVATKEEADHVIAVAETRSDSRGRFRLLLPSTFK